MFSFYEAGDNFKPIFKSVEVFGTWNVVHWTFFD